MATGDQTGDENVELEGDSVAVEALGVEKGLVRADARSAPPEK
jgi:hypothetical protein